MHEHLKPAVLASVGFLEEQGFRYALIEGIALSQWGVPRYTHDVDLKVLVPNVDYESMRASLRAGFPRRGRPHVPENPLIVDAVIDGVIVDFLLALPGYEDLIVERATRRDLGGWSAWICSAEDLIIQKAVAGRGKDWVDIEGILLAQHGRLDEAYVEDWLAQFAEALDKPELLTEYKRLRGQSRALVGDYG